MKVAEFMQWANDCQERLGSRPSAVTLNNQDVRVLLDELQAEVRSNSTPTPNLNNPPSTWVQEVRSPLPRSTRPGWCLKLAGVDIYRSVDVPRGEFRLD